MYEHFCEAADSILTQTHEDTELVIVVDGTPSVYAQVVDDYGDCDDTVITCNDENKGLLTSRNRGAKLASGDAVAFIDDDAIADKEWVSQLVRAYNEEDAVAVGGKMVPDWVAGKPSYLPEEFYWLVGATHRGFADGPGEVRNTFGSNISFRADVFENLGGFDTNIGGRKGEKNLQSGETELCVRLQQKYGQGVWYDPSAEVLHKVFSYRTSPRWLADRAFWQGYSKRVMEIATDESATEESDFAYRLLTQFVPNRIRDLIHSPSAQGVIQLISLFILTFTVAFGYAYGVFHDQTTTTAVTVSTDDPAYRVLWLRPSRGDNISVRRQRIAEELVNYDVEVDICDVTGTDAIGGIRQAFSKNYDAIFGNVRMGLYLGYPLARVLRKPFVATVSDPISDISNLPRPIYKVLEWYEWYVLARADARSFTYQSTFDEAERRGIAGRKLPNAVSYEKFAHPDTKVVKEAEQILKQEGVDLNKPIAIYIGGLTESTYKMSAIVGSADRCPNWEFIFIGEGEQEESIIEAARNHPNVYYPGAFRYDLVPGFLACADVGFCFKDAEQPLKVMEYGAAGVTTIAQPGELQKRISADEAVFIEPTPDAIANTLERLADNPKDRDRLAQNLQEHAENVSWEMVGDEFYEILKQVSK